MVVIRLARRGSKKNPFYHIVVADRRMPRDGRFIEQVGYYNPMARGHDVRLRIVKDRVFYWLSQGASTSLRVKYLIKQIEQLPEEAKKVIHVKTSLKGFHQVEQSEEAQKKIKTKEA